MGQGTTGALTLPVGGIGRLRRLAHAAAPEECCGILAGRRGAVTEIRPVSNVAGRGRFEMDPQELFEVLSDLDAGGVEVVGSYHSHPGGRATPSTSDVDEAVPGWVTVVVGRRRVRAWEIGSGGVSEIPCVERTW